MIHKFFKQLFTRKDEESNCPCEGIFWIIGDELVSFIEQVDNSGKDSTHLEHIKVWEDIKDKYKVSGVAVPYNYFPRGRVAITPKIVYGVVISYLVYIYLDPCISTADNIQTICHEFRLANNPKCHFKYVGSNGAVMSSHYDCHNCRTRNLTDEETEIYESWLEAESKETGEKTILIGGYEL